MKISISRKFYSGTLHFIQIFWFFPFLGIFTSETRCLNCETVTSKDEDFFDLSIDVEQNTSITSCLKNFSNTETLCSDNKFQCDSCCTLQEAHVSIFLKKFFLNKLNSKFSEFRNVTCNFFLETNENQETPYHFGITFETIQVHGTI